MLHDCYGINSENHLCIGGVDTVTLAKEYGTPLYVLDEDKIRERCRVYLNAMRKYFSSDSLPFYASKALSFLGIYKIIQSEGLGTDIVSPGELYTALEAGFDPEYMCFHGNNKTDADIEYGVSSGVGYFVCDSVEELVSLSRIAAEHGTVQKILLRITPGIDPHTFKAVVTGNVDSKFGFPIKTGAAASAVEYALGLSGVRLCGFHCHIGSQIFDVEPFTDAARIMVDFIADMKERFGFEADILNLGGGFGVRYTENMPDSDIEANIKKLAEVLDGCCLARGVRKPRIFMEPGRGIVAAAGLTLYTAGTFKTIDGFRSYLSVDGGMPDNPRYALYSSEYTFCVANKMDLPRDTECTVAGRCCESGDLLGEGVLMQRAERGDIIATLVTGAYNYSMASNYNRIPRPAIVTVKGGEHRLAVRRETYEDLCRNERLEICTH